MNARDIGKLLDSFLARYDTSEKDAVWQIQSQNFRTFWEQRIMAGGEKELNDLEIDEIVRILDRNGKGNKPSTEAVARAMIPQGAWRRLFNEIKSRNPLSRALNTAFTAKDASTRAEAIDMIYKINTGKRNNLTGKSGNAINAMLAAYDPLNNLSVISLNDRRKLIEYFAFDGGPDFDKDSMGRRITASQSCILSGFRKLAITANARTLSVFLYSPGVDSLWKIKEMPPPDPPVEPDLNGDKSLFYMESQLEDFLIENWDKTELGRNLDLIEEEGELVSQQYRTGIGVIDILAQDKKTRQLVVIELKKNQTSDDTVGQLTRYMGWLEEHKTKGKPTKGIIIAAQYDNRLHYALKKVSDVEVYLYRVSFKLDEFKKTG